LYTNEARAIAAFPIWFLSIAPLSGIICFGCAQSRKIRHRCLNFFFARISFWKSKIRDVKYCFFQSFFAMDALAPFSEALGSAALSERMPMNQYSVKK
jgi:hypothetical protein